MTKVLLILVFTGAFDQGVAIHEVSHPFDDMKACEVAGEYMIRQQSGRGDRMYKCLEVPHDH